VSTMAARLTRPAEFLLVRLLAPTKQSIPPARLREEMSRLLRTALDVEHWQSLVDELAHAGLLMTKPLRLTESGQAHALAWLGLEELPLRTTWRLLRDRYLIPRLLEIAQDAGDIQSRIRSRDGLGASLLKRRYDLPLGTAPTLNAALEALACQQLGFAEETKLSTVRDRVLCRLLGVPEPLSRKQLGPQVVRAAIGARRADLPSFRDTVLHDWLAGPVTPQTSDGEDAGPPPEPEPFDLPVFAATVLAAARTCRTGWFGDNKVFIHHVWEQLQGETNLPVRSLEEFKKRLVEANHVGLLQLSRADLVQAMDPADVQQSETRYLDAVFHFIRTEGDDR